MDSRARQILSAIVGLGIIGAFLYGGIVAVRAGFHVLESLDSDIAVAIIAAAATAFVSVLSIVLGKAYEGRALIHAEHREKKTPVYEDLIHFMSRILIGQKTGDAPTEKEILSFLSTFTQRIMVWGSDEVLAAWIKWRRAALNEKQQKEDPMVLLLLYEKLILEIRRDLGHKNKDLHSGDVLALYVNDIDQHLNQRAN
jgi:hypothetical protein